MEDNQDIQNITVNNLSDEDIIDQCSEFLKASSDYFFPLVNRRERDLDMYSNNFWDDETKRAWKRESRPAEQWNCWRVFVNSIASPFSNSAWHVELNAKEDPTAESIQESINRFESDNDVKVGSIGCLENASITGVGAMVFSILEENGVQQIKIENIDDPSMVAFDPSITTTSGSDAEEGAIINYVSIKKAKRLYGDDIVGLDFPRSCPAVCKAGEQWPLKDRSIQVINYYFKDSDGKVVFTKICGNKVIEKAKLPTTIIPIIRKTGYKIKTADKKTDYIGVVRATYSLQLGANIGYSTLLERMNRNPKANFLMPVSAVTDLEKYYEISGSDASALLLYNGTIPPTPIVENYETADLVNTINQAMTLMSQVLGIPLSGIEGINFGDKTATEVLVQQTNSQSNVSCFYRSAYEAMRTVGRIIIQLLNNGEDLEFSLQNGPDVITRNAKKRQLLAVMSGMVPDNMKPILAKHLSETLEDAFTNDLTSDIIANMDTSLKLTNPEKEDAYALHVMKQMQAASEDLMSKLDEQMQLNASLQEELKTANMALMSAKDQQVLDFQKFMVQHKDDVRLKEADLSLKGLNIDNQAKKDSDKAMLEAQKLALNAAKDLEEARSNNFNM